jgi:predicted helicase
VVNGKSAIEWVVALRSNHTQDSGIQNDPNDWATSETQNTFWLVLSIINVSVQTVEIVKELPKVKFESKTTVDYGL